MSKSNGNRSTEWAMSTVSRLFIFVFFAILPVRIFASDEVCIGDFKYSIDEINLCATVTGLANDQIVLVNPIFPDKVVVNEMEYPVVQVGNGLRYKFSDPMRGSLLKGSVKLPNGCKIINKYALEGDDNYLPPIKAITFSDCLEEIGSYAFNCALDVSKIDLPVTFNRFGGVPFYHCLIDTIICRNPDPPKESNGYNYGLASDYFGSTPNEGVLLVPKKSIELYKKAPYWEQFKNIQGLDGIPVKSIYLNHNELSLLIGESASLLAKISPEDADDSDITWTSSNIDIATVAADGTVTAVSAGTAIITATCDAVSATCRVTVNPVLATTVTINVPDMEVFVGDMFTMTATVKPDNTTDKTVAWASLTPEIAEICAQTGVLIALAPGTANITATCGDVTGSATITIKPVTAMTVTVTVPGEEVFVGDKVMLSATVIPDNATDKSIVWSCSTPEIATIDAQTGELTALAPGEAKVTAICGEVTGTATITVKPVTAISVTLSAEDLTLLVGQTGKLTASVTPANTTDATIVWTSANEAIATVVPDGTVTAVSVGTTTITAICGAVSATCEVTVNPVTAATVTINVPDIEVFVGEKVTLSATVIPDNTTDNTVVWGCSTPEIATIDVQTGELTAIAPGEARVTATCGEVTGTATIIVKPILATSVTLNAKDLTLLVGQTGKLTATVTPANTTDATIVWSSANDAIATVAADGTVTAVSLGTTTITATCGVVSASCKVTVNPVTATTITINVPDMEVFAGDRVTLTATIIPDNTTDKTVVWACSTPEIATINAQTGELTALAPGEARITVTCGEVTGTATITVKPVAATSVTLSAENLTLLVGQTGKLTATVAPANTTDATIVWTSANEAVAMVAADGTVTAISAGMATITATCGAVSTTCTVTVNPRPETPREYVRKGNGTSCTFVVMMNLSDAQLASGGYHFAYGYTDVSGEDHIIATSGHRYCHTSSQIYNDRQNDFWAYAYWTGEGGEIIVSLRRHLDGRTDEMSDTKPLAVFLRMAVDTSNSDNWIKPTSRGAQINLSCAESARLTVHAINGTLIYTRDYESGMMVTEEISSDLLVPNTYIITVQSGETIISKKIIIR